MTASSRRPQPPIEIGMSTTPIMTVHKTTTSGSGSARPCACPTDQTTTMVNAWMRHPMLRITGPFDPKRTRWTSVANVAKQREYRHRLSGRTILGASKRPNAPARISAPYTTSTTSRYPPSALRPGGSSRTTNPSAIIRPTPTPRSITALVTALCQLLPSRTRSQARTPSPATLGKTCAKNTPTAVAAIMAVRVARISRAASEPTILYQRRPESGISSVATKIANAAHRKSSSGMRNKTWFKSICRETYQKHVPVTSSLATRIATFSALVSETSWVSSSLPIAAAAACVRVSGHSLSTTAEHSEPLDNPYGGCSQQTLDEAVALSQLPGDRDFLRDHVRSYGCQLVFPNEGCGRRDRVQ